MASPSPLKQDARPSTFEPKVVSLYKTLFADDLPDDPQRSEGFWTEFFLLPPSFSSLTTLLTALPTTDLLHLAPITRALFSRCVSTFRSGRTPQADNALDTLEVFLRCVLQKKYANPSGDVISVLAGLEGIDGVFSEFVGGLDAVIKGKGEMERRRRAVRVGLGCMVGAFGTGLGSYFCHRDLFPGIMKFINDPEAGSGVFEAFVFLGVLANYNKFEMQNPYQLRLDDFVNETVIQKIVREIGLTSIRIRTDYVALQDDLPVGWSLNSMLSYVGLTVLSGGGPKPKPPSAPNGDLSKLSFDTLPNPRAAILLAIYDFVKANKLFCHNLVTYTDKDPNVEPPISAFISLTSYLLQHASRSKRCSLYARTNLLVLRILLEDPTLCKKLASDDTQAFIRLARQKQPTLPVVRGKRILLTAIIDLIADGLNHNRRKRLDVELYNTQLTILSRAIGYLIKARTRLTYHWSSLWRSLFSLLTFLTQFSDDLTTLSNIAPLLDTLTSLLVTSLTMSESFLSTAADADDLFYKLVEAGDTLLRFRDSYSLTSSSHPVSTLLAVYEHYNTILQENKGKKQLSPDLVQEVIRKGYETLELDPQAVEMQKGREEGYREARERGFLKKVARAAVVDLEGVWEVGRGVAWPEEA